MSQQSGSFWEPRSRPEPPPRAGVTTTHFIGSVGIALVPFLLLMRLVVTTFTTGLGNALGSDASVRAESFPTFLALAIVAIPSAISIWILTARISTPERTFIGGKVWSVIAIFVTLIVILIGTGFAPLPN